MRANGESAACPSRAGQRAAEARQLRVRPFPALETAPVFVSVAATQLSSDHLGQRRDDEKLLT